ncbi:MAG: hypothetical protein EOP81_06840 [Variovorax sp.]|nr:MAG: hypothetical protein EOP81_06840 [Variovorax sp.]
MSQEPLQITIGPRWSLFTYARDDMRLLGTVQRGMQIGALASLPDGGYAQVNGDIVEPLNASRVLYALRATHGRPVEPARTAPPATVIVKKRRRVVLPGATPPQD